MPRAVATILPAALALLLAGCGGEEEDDPSAAPSASAPSAAAVAPSEAPAPEPGAGPIEGALVSVFSPGLGFFEIDRQTGAATPIAVEGVGFIERDEPAVVADGAAFTIGYTPVEGQPFRNEVDLVAVDLATGAASVLADLGQSRASPEDAIEIETVIVGAGPETVWLRQSAGASGDTYIAISRADGSETARVPPGEQRAFGAVVVDDALYANLADGIARLDPATGMWERLFGFGDIDTGSFITPEDLDAFVSTRDGTTVPEEQRAAYIDRLEPRPSDARWTAGDGALWWVFSEQRGLQGGGTTVASGIVRYDLASGMITGIWPIASDVVAWSETGYAALSQPTLQLIDGVLFIADPRENGPLYRLDPATGEVTAHAIELGEENDFTRIAVLPTDPEGLWLDVTRFVVVSEENGRSTLGEIFVERYDTATGERLVSVSVDDILATP